MRGALRQCGHCEEVVNPEDSGKHKDNTANRCLIKIRRRLHERTPVTSY